MVFDGSGPLVKRCNGIDGSLWSTQNTPLARCEETKGGENEDNLRKKVFAGSSEILENSKEATSSQEVDHSGKVQDGENVVGEKVGDGRIIGEEAAN